MKPLLSPDYRNPGGKLLDAIYSRLKKEVVKPSQDLPQALQTKLSQIRSGDREPITSVCSHLITELFKVAGEERAVNHVNASIDEVFGVGRFRHISYNTETEPLKLMLDCLIPICFWSTMGHGVDSTVDTLLQPLCGFWLERALKTQKGAPCLSVGCLYGWKGYYLYDGIAFSKPGAPLYSWLGEPLIVQERRPRLFYTYEIFDPVHPGEVQRDQELPVAKGNGTIELAFNDGRFEPSTAAFIDLFTRKKQKLEPTPKPMYVEVSMTRLKASSGEVPKNWTEALACAAALKLT